MKTWQKWVVGVSIILMSIGAAAVAVFDGDPTTNVNVAATVDGVKKGVSVIADTGATGK